MTGRDARFLGLIILLGWTMTTGLVRSENETSRPSFMAEFLRDLDQLEQKLVSLAEAFPAETYTWRPGEGVRSVSEVYLHISSTNFLLPTILGVQPPQPVDRDLEKKYTEKKKVIEILKASLAHVRRVAETTKEADLQRPVKLFGREAVAQDVFYLLASHMHEHLGQLIAYARINGVVPPWSARRRQNQP